MKAIYYEKYGSPDNFRLEEIDKPLPKGDEVLVKVKASSINSWDWDLTTGRPYAYRLLFGMFKPAKNVIGIDIAGVVEEVGPEVKGLKVGDEVYGDISAAGFGGFAEYASAPERLIALKPKNLSFEEAAAVPHGGVLALQSVEFKGKLEPGQRILINGAGGSTGPFALQMAKEQDLHVTCVDSSDKFVIIIYEL